MFKFIQTFFKNLKEASEQSRLLEEQEIKSKAIDNFLQKERSIKKSDILYCQIMMSAGIAVVVQIGYTETSGKKSQKTYTYNRMSGLMVEG